MENKHYSSKQPISCVLIGSGFTLATQSGERGPAAVAPPRGMSGRQNPAQTWWIRAVPSQAPGNMVYKTSSVRGGQWLSVADIASGSPGYKLLGHPSGMTETELSLLFPLIFTLIGFSLNEEACSFLAGPISVMQVWSSYLVLAQHPLKWQLMGLVCHPAPWSFTPSLPWSPCANTSLWRSQVGMEGSRRVGERARLCGLYLPYRCKNISLTMCVTK